MKTFDDRIIVALDLPAGRAALDIVDRIGDAARFYKIGLGLIATEGFELAAELKFRRKMKVFLDAKFFDIGHVVGNAVAGVMRLEPDLLTVHGDPQIVEAAVRSRGDRSTRILAVTVLTSYGRQDLDDALVRDGEVSEIVRTRAERAFSAGADGVICSARESSVIRRIPGAAGKLIVTPGIRPAGSGIDDQKRATTPRQAIADGVDHFVVGRPIIRSPDPRRAVLDILNDLDPNSVPQPESDS